MLWPRHSSGRKDMKFGMYLILLLSLIRYTTAAGVFNCLGGAIYIVAHPDDDLLFAGPALQSDLASNACHTSIYLTSGDSGSGSDYAQSREGGSEAAYAQMMSVANNYTEFFATFGGQPVLVRTLIGAPGVQKLWFRLPDGNIDGSGYSVTGSESLRDLYFGTIGTINTVSMNAYYTYNDLQNALVEILNARQPTVVRTLDHLSAFDGGDHADHIATGRITREAVSAYTLGSPTFAGYMGYPVSNLPPTLSTTSSEYKAKCAAFFAYTPYDVNECHSLSDCQAAGRGEVYWLQRQYAVTPALATTSSSAQTPPKRLPAGTNVALTAVPSVSSVESGTSAAGLNDGVISGYPANETAEWATNHGGVGSWAKLTWSTLQNLTGVILYDRPNLDDWLQAGKLTFSDGRAISFVNPLNEGTGLIVNFNQSIVTNTLLLTVTKVSASTSNVGLSELQAWGVACPRCVLSTVTTTTPTPSKTTTSAASTPTGALGPNLAQLGTATSSTTADGQPASAAIDGILSGYLENGTGNEAAEWSSDHQGVGATLTINFSSAQTMNRFILYDRPNMNDQITGATATFSNGSVVTIPSLPNNGAGLTVNFAQKTTTKVTLRVTKVSSMTSNIGLMEWQMYLVTAAATTTATTTSTTTATTTATAPATTIATAITITITSAPATGTATTTSTSMSKTPTAAPVPVSTPSPGVDIALVGAATASTGAAGQGPERAKDGIIGGYTENGQGNSSAEWSTISQGVGAFLTITWSSPIFINQFVLYDRPNLNDQITGGSVTFSDGSTVSIPALANAGTATPVSFTGRATTSVTLTVTSTSSTTSNIGLSEWQIYYVLPTASTTTTTGSAAAASPTPNTDLAMLGTATSSSNGPGQGAEKACDGLIGGYTTSGGDYTQEWASNGQGVGATLTITWSSPITMNRFVMYDRPNLNDQVTAGTVTFSDGSVVAVPTLVNAGTATTINFSTKTTTTVVFTVTGVSSTTSNIGLSEWQIYYVSESTTTTSPQKSGTAQVESLPNGAPQVVASNPTTTPSSLTTKSTTASRSSTTSSTRSTVSLAPSATISSTRSTVSLSATAASTTPRSSATASGKVTSSSTTSRSSVLPSPTTVAVGGTAANSSRAMRTYAAYMVASVPSGASNSSATTYDACSYKCDTFLACTYFTYTQATKICSLYTQTNAFGSFTPVTNGKMWNLFVPATNCTVYATATKNASCAMWQTSSPVCATGTGTTAWSVYPSWQGTGTRSAELSRAVSTDYNACLTRTLSTPRATYFEFAFDTRMCYLKSTGALVGLTTTINFAHTVLGTCASNAAAANGAVCIDRVACGTAPVVSSTTSSASKSSTSTSKSTSTRTSLSVTKRSAITGRAQSTALIVRDRSN
ncbi:hypothetical protein MVLG_01294 [Microbotryum lychnidis-dioicae p1A1 Lamole]|uniref:N-acetylglucosaminylphosphatidylinositol deacetylase n=1 Tax=Microbotryum lychnidis-dioicae (strain p1A1 Lamole / MvSl-1064) TaxID=683840 RepID=U5H1P1_USTV1|nr:hypothetical protein MVLG_01294 [Microbotryum lychnidis-dioicae p1A1 Lamole]|eukprot:KDE08515.1 hypothetical protein MVLG_01294 [Microbotryum lychnidis-dioicae p1A1 Lamole]